MKQSELDAENKAINAKQVIEQFLEGEVGKGTIEMMRRTYYDQWRTCKEEDVLKLWREARSLEAVVEAMRVVQDRGEVATRQRKARDEADEFNKRRMPGRRAVAPADS